MAKQTRYAVTVDFYIYTNSDDEAIKTASIVAQKINHAVSESNDCKVVAVHNASTHKPWKIS